MNFNQIRLSYVRFIGAGAVAAAGLITLIKTLPTIAAAFRESFKSLREKKGAGGGAGGGMPGGMGGMGGGMGDMDF